MSTLNQSDIFKHCCVLLWVICLPACSHYILSILFSRHHVPFPLFPLPLHLKLLHLSFAQYPPMYMSLFIFCIWASSWLKSGQTLSLRYRANKDFPNEIQNHGKTVVRPCGLLFLTLMFKSERLVEAGFPSAAFSLSSFHCSLISVFRLSPAVFHRCLLTKCSLSILTNFKQLILYSTH